MSDNKQNQQTQDTQDTSQLQRIFKIGGNLITEDENLVNLTNEEAQQMLAFTYPEVQNANIVTTVHEGHLVVEFMTRAGRKG